MYKKMMLILCLILVILTIGIVSAFDDADTLASSDVNDEQDMSDVLNEDLQENGGDLVDVTPEDFDVVIADKWISLMDRDVAVTFDWPDYVKQKNESLNDSYNDKFTRGFKLLIL